jgi:hypothetical protein
MSQNVSQQEVCLKFDSAFAPPNADDVVGIALSSLDQLPLNALRHPTENGASGWYIWGGETLSQDKDFFQPLHVHHLVEAAPLLIPYLALSPGWRVLLAPNQLEVWYDSSLLNV